MKIRSKHCALRLSAPLLVAMLAVGPALAGPQNAPLSLEEAVMLALAASPEAALAAGETEIAQADSDAADGRRGPRVDLSADYTLTTNPVLVFGNLLRQERFTAADFDLERLNNPDPLSNWNATVSLSQALYAGGRIGAGAEAARTEVEARLAEEQRARQRVRHATVSIYADAVLALQQLDAARQVVATAQAHEALVGDLVDAGLAVSADLLQAQLRTAEAREAEVRATGAADTSHAVLNLMLGRSETTPLVLVEGAQLIEQLSPDLPRESLVARALASRPDLIAARHRIDASAHGVDAARGARLPNVGFWGAFEANDREFFGAEGTNWTLMVQARWNAFDGSATASQVAQARIRGLQAERAAQLLERDIRMSVFAAYTELRTARERLAQVASSIDVARASLVTVEDRYREGMVTLVDLLEAQTAMTRSLARDVAARRDVLLAAAALELAVGDAFVGADEPDNQNQVELEQTR